jgi:hypothetical protein
VTIFKMIWMVSSIKFRNSPFKARTQKHMRAEYLFLAMSITPLRHATVTPLFKPYGAVTRTHVAGLTVATVNNEDKTGPFSHF